MPRTVGASCVAHDTIASCCDGDDHCLAHKHTCQIWSPAQSSALRLRVRRERPDVVLLDLRLPDMLAADGVPELRAVSPDSRILIFTAFPDHSAVRPTLPRGVVACWSRCVRIDSPGRAVTGCAQRQLLGRRFTQRLRRTDHTAGVRRPTTCRDRSHERPDR